MFKILKLGHVEFEVQDLSRMTEYYRDIIGLTVTERNADTAYLSTVVDHHSVILRQSNNGTRLTKLAFQVAPIETKDIVKHRKGMAQQQKYERAANHPSLKL